MAPTFEEDRTSFFGLSRRRADVVFFLLAFCFLYLHLFIIPATPIYYEMDHVALLNDAKRMVGGEVIYRDFFEFVFPGTHSLYAAFIAIFGPKYWIANFLILAHGLASAAICVAFSRHLFGRTAYSYLPAAIYLYFGFRWLGIDGEHRMFSPVFGCLAVLVLLKGRTLPRVALAGFFCALSSFFTQQRGVLALGAVGLFIIYELGFRERKWTKMFSYGCVLAGTFAISLSLMVLPFVVMAGPRTFYECTIEFLAHYAQDPDTNSVQTYWGTIAKLRTFGYLITAVALFYYLLIPLVYLATITGLWWRRRIGNSKNESSVLLICLLGACFSIGTFAPNAGRLFQIAVPAIVLFCWLVFALAPRSDSAVKLVLAGLVMFGGFQVFRLQTTWDAQLLDTPSGRLAFLSPIYLERYAWLSEHARPDDYVYETYNSHVNFPLGLRNPSRMSILLNTGYTTHEQVLQAIDDLKSKNARYIIWDGAWTPEMQTLGDDEKLKPFYKFMTENYELRQRFTPYDGREREIWERKSAGQ